MAALPDYPGEPLIDLRELTAEDLKPLLEEEVLEWRASLDWDFRPSADLVRRFVQVHALNGLALAIAGRIAGYSYFVSEEGKGLVGDFYVTRAARTAAHENRLLEAVLDSMWRTPGMRRIEAQLMMIGSPLDRAAPYLRWFQAYPRKFLEASLAGVHSLPARDPEGAAFSSWTESWQEEAARLIAHAYRGHVDSLINDQYRSAAGARRFLTNIVQYPGCGSFFAPASFIAWDRAERKLCGISLASLVAEDAGHITQICVAPSHHGRKIGYELLRRSLVSMAAHGCRSVSLTVTSANEPALRLYEGAGFRTRRDFAAYVWEIA